MADLTDQIKYLDLAGLTNYDAKIKGEIIGKAFTVANNDTTLVVSGGETETEETADGRVITKIKNAKQVKVNLDNKTLKTIAEGDDAGKITVNIDGETIVADENGVLSVVSTALEQYEGAKAIKVTDVAARNYTQEEIDAAEEGDDAYGKTTDDVIPAHKVISLAIDPDDQVLTQSDNGVKVNLKVVAIDPKDISDPNVREAYKLVGTEADITDSAIIKVYKDKSLLGVKLLHATDGVKPTYNKADGNWTDINADAQTETNRALCFAYETADGTLSIEAIPVGLFLTNEEFGDGLNVDSTGTVSIKLINNKIDTGLTYTEEEINAAEEGDDAYGKTAGDPKLVDILSTTENELAVADIQTAINKAANASATTLTTVAADETIPDTGAPKVVVSVENMVDGHKNYTVTGQDLASAKLLAAEVTRATEAETEIDLVVGIDAEIKDEKEVRVWKPTTNYHATGEEGKDVTHTVKNNLAAIDLQLKKVSDFISNIEPIATADINALF